MLTTTLSAILVALSILRATCLAGVHNFMNTAELIYYFDTHDMERVPDYEVVFLPIDHGAPPAPTLNLDFSAFGRDVSLRLMRNEHILAPSFKTFVHEAGDKVHLFQEPAMSCHYLHKDRSLVASVSLCEADSMNALVFFDNYTLEIKPLPKRMSTLLESKGNNRAARFPHIVKRASLNDVTSLFADSIQIDHEPFDTDLLTVEASKMGGMLTLELAVFFDAAAFKLFAPYFHNDIAKLRDMLLAYINAVQALYHQDSLRVPLEIVIVRMDIMKFQPGDLHHHNGERGQLLDSFCDFQRKRNHKDDSNPDHWDMGIYVSGLDFYAIENGVKSGATMGLATVGGVCLDKYNCVISEFGTVNSFGKPYPSAGFTSVYILAHEIGHNLGMHHDGTSNSCAKEGFVMSPSRGTNGETQWSSCSASVMEKLTTAPCLSDKPKRPVAANDHSKFMESPGQRYSAKAQCEILLRDKDAMVLPSQKQSEICYNLHCKTPHRSGFYFAGPALEGTSCGFGMWCQGGFCVKLSKPAPTEAVVPGGWSDWTLDKCKSNCLEKSKGFQERHRTCDNPIPVNTDDGCEGASFGVALCDDAKLCLPRRKDAVKYATEKCREFAKLLPDLEKPGAGLQAFHEDVRPWMGCAIFCKRADTGSYYTPRVELNDMGVPAYFPDGTWCHTDDSGINYYCVQHHCLPENIHSTKSEFVDDMEDDDVLLLQNAMMNGIMTPDLMSYLSVTEDRKPLQTSITMSPEMMNQEWEIKDYLDLPSNEKNDINNWFGGLF